MLRAATAGVRLGRLQGEAAAIMEGMVQVHRYSRDERPNLFSINHKENYMTVLDFSRCNRCELMLFDGMRCLWNDSVRVIELSYQASCLGRMIWRHPRSRADPEKSSRRVEIWLDVES